jgi:hypothetical protein
MGYNTDDLDHWRQRFFGWLPYDKETKWFLVGNLAYLFWNIFLWPKVPKTYVFGWWPVHHFLVCFVTANWAALMWGLYYHRWWPLRDEDDTIIAHDSKKGVIIDG